MFNMPCGKRRRGNPGKPRNPYKVKSSNRLFGSKKTTKPDGYREYMKMYMKDRRRLLKQ
jgi:hypothetical protein